MRAYRYRLGSSIDTLELVDTPKPVVRPGGVLLRMRAASLNYRDLLVLGGAYPRAQQETIVPLSDGCGEVIETGEGVTELTVGDRVAPIFFQSWDRGPMRDGDGATALGGSIDGVAAEYCALAADRVVRVPDHLDDTEAASLPCAAVTAWNGLHGPVAAAAGDTVLVLGTGGVAIFALQFAHASGARVIVTSSSNEKLERARAIGADETINYVAHAEWSGIVREMTGGRGVDHVIETGGGGTMLESIRATRRGGTIHVIGLIAPGTIDPVNILLGGVTLRAAEVGSRAMFQAMNSAIEHARIRPVVDREFAFDALPEALDYLKAGRHFGKIAIRF